MKNKQLQVINKKDIHAVFIWPADSVTFLENTITIKTYVKKTPIAIESDGIWVDPSEGDIITNIRSNNIALLKMYVEDMFPHLTYVGHPTVDGELFDDWFAYVDQRGADIINNEVDGDTKVTSPSEIRNID
jgi:folate-binding Fe-S cluster repair protein YgfZ